MSDSKDFKWSLRTLTAPPDSNYRFPEDDLLLSLVDCYFENMNIFFPLLHRPTYEKQIAAGLHLQDSSFGATVIMVCAIGSRFSEDPRVTHYRPGVDLPTDWELFHQVKKLRFPIFAAQSLQDLQLVCVSSGQLPNLSSSHCVSAGCSFLGWIYNTSTRMDSHWNWIQVYSANWWAQAEDVSTKSFRRERVVETRVLVIIS
jgi:hypothetical protein